MTVSDTIPTTKPDLLKAVSKALGAQQQLREVMQGVAAQAAGSKQAAKAASK